MKAVSGRDFCKLIERKGWELKRINGSQHIFAKSGQTTRLCVPAVFGKIIIHFSRELFSLFEALGRIIFTRRVESDELLLGAGYGTAKLHSLDHRLAQGCHHTSPA